jgi:hypothetical protein
MIIAGQGNPFKESLKMLNLSKSDGTPIASFENYRELYLHINYIENLKLLPNHPEFGKSNWSFLVLSPLKVIELTHTLKKEYDPAILSRALKERSGIIEICEGDPDNLRLIIDSPGVDVEGFRKEFCDDYCNAHSMTVKEFE